MLDYEQHLIKYCSVDKRFKNILNKNRGQQSSHDYFNRKYYRNQFQVLWNQLKDKGLVKKSLKVIENDNIFKFSPYNALTGEQNEISIAIINDILDSFETKENSVSLVDGCAGTGKTVTRVFKECGNGLESSMVIAPSDVVKEEYDILIVDESHRLSKRKILRGIRCLMIPVET